MNIEPFGDFSDDGLEYVITRPLAPPRAQVNFLWNDMLISGLNQFGTGDGVFNNQTLTYNHPKGRVRLIRDGRRYFYLRDVENGRFWNTGFAPIHTKGAHFTTYVGLGYSRFDMEYDNILTTSRVFLAGDEPVEIWEFTVENRSDSERSLWLCPYVEWQLGGYPTFSSIYSYLRSIRDSINNAVLSYNTSEERPHDRYNAFLATDTAFDLWCGGRRDFMGPFGTVTRPQTLLEGQFSCREAWCEELAGAMAIPLSLAAGEKQVVTVLLGSFDSDEEKDRLIDKVLAREYRRDTWDSIVRQKRRMIQKVWVETPDAQINRLVNIWSKQQIQLCVEFGRDGARGFRDTLQDAWGIAPFNASLAKAKIKEALAHQYKDGHTVRGWLPLQPNHYSDGPAWVAPTVAAYLQETGHADFLRESVPYLDGGQATVLEHMLTGVRHLSEDTGLHGLVLAHEGDWNDSLNWMGREGKGESVWTSIALYHSCNVIAEMAGKLLLDGELQQEMTSRSERIASTVETHGWEDNEAGGWYLAGWSDFGNPVGSFSNTEGKVFLNPQTWALMTGLAKGRRRQACLRAIDEELDSPHGSLTLWPAYTAGDENVGRVTMILPGMYENGTPYCHGTAFKIIADLVMGRANQALASWIKVMPDNPDHPSCVSGCEPYAFTNQYLGPTNGRAGDSISGWITGTAGWMFRAVVEYFCGIKPDYHGFTIQPCLPDTWPTVRIRRDLRGRNYDIRIQKTDDGYSILLDGQSYDGGLIPFK